jgi:ribA/ribD-fused uncharacterized protein
MEDKKYTFFWKSESPFSQWHPSTFTVSEVVFKTAEMHMMYKKAMLFGDAETAEEILKAKHPRDCKALGRKVKGFINDLWEADCKRFVYEGNHAKFTQNPAMLKILMDTGNTKLVEAAPNDYIWGIGLSEEDAKKIPESEWPGTNWLGEILTELRENLKEQL